MMLPHAARAATCIGRGDPREVKRFGRQLDDHQTTATLPDLQEIRTSWLSRRAGIPANLAAALAPLVFGGDAR